MNFTGLIFGQDGEKDLIKICDQVNELSAEGCAFRARLFALGVVVIEPSRVLVKSFGDIFKVVALKTQELFSKLSRNESFGTRALILTEFLIKAPSVVVFALCALIRVASVLIYHLGQTIFCPSEMRTFEDENQIYPERDRINPKKTMSFIDRELKPGLDRIWKKDLKAYKMFLMLLSCLK